MGSVTVAAHVDELWVLGGSPYRQRCRFMEEAASDNAVVPTTKYIAIVNPSNLNPNRTPNISRNSDQWPVL